MAKWLGWIYPSGAKRPASGKGSVEDVVSHAAPVRAALATHASEIASAASFYLNSLPEHRTGQSSIHAQPRDLDWIVYLQEGPNGKGGSAGIEAELGVLSKAIRSKL